MLNLKVLSAFAAAALGAALLLAMPGFSPEVEARTPPAAVKSDRLDIRPVAGPDCQQAWPYYEASCLRDPQHAGQSGRHVRIVSTDRFDR